MAPSATSDLRSRSLDHQNPLSSVLPLDWLFSDNNEPDAPMESPKEVRKTAAEAKCGSSSSGTDSETKNLLPTGAIPKKRLQDQEQAVPEATPSAAVANAGRTWQRRAFRRRRTQDEISPGRDGSEAPGEGRKSSVTDETTPTPAGGELGSEGDDAAAMDLRRRILDILSTPDNQEGERELDKLKRELVHNKESSPSALALPTPAGSATIEAGRRTASEEEARRERRRLRRARRRGQDREQRRGGSQQVHIA